MWPPERRQDVARDAIEQLMLDRGLARAFDPAVERAAGRARDLGLETAEREVASGERRDLRNLPTFTIDPATAKDFDDAISAEPLSGGGDDGGVGNGVRVWVHIADVSAHVPPGSLVDLEARRRGTSVYVPGAVEPMLPEALSNDACSLVSGVDRPAVTVELELDASGQVGRTAFYRSLIRSSERLDYERVDRIFAGAERAYEPWGAPLEAARRAAASLASLRGSQNGRGGALTLDSPEPEFAFDADGHVSEVRMRVQTESHRLIEHLMIAANEAVARLLSERRVPCLYRVHERPSAERVRRLIDQLASLGVPTPPAPDDISPSQAAELMGESSRRIERHVRATISKARAGDASVSPTGGRMALTSLLLRSLPQALYSPKNIGHAGLGAAFYCHFTSPIRRYPDLVCHRALLSAVGAGERAHKAAELRELGEWTSERERDALTIERDAEDLARCFALEQTLYRDGWEQTFAGEVVGLISAGAFIAFGEAHGPAARARAHPARAADAFGTGEGMPIYEGMLPVRRMRVPPAPSPRGPSLRKGRREDPPQPREWWEINEQGTILHGERTGATLRLGDPIEVQVARVDTARGRVDLVPPADPSPAG
ncbi:MAG TPA: RNB domain-containing ribonuclease [Solirubrobacteraceae bacterium]